MLRRKALTAALTLAIAATNGDCFSIPSVSHHSVSRSAIGERASVSALYNSQEENEISSEPSRRNVLVQGLALGGSLLVGGGIQVEDSLAAVGTLPEFNEANAILQGLTVNVADQAQQKSMIEFLVQGFGFKVLRQRINGPIEETWLGFGSEQLSIPEDFKIPVSSFGEYGGHASLCVRYDTQARAPLYRTGDSAPGDNIAFLQVGVPSYRVSQMSANGGNILDAYGFVNVVSPSGLPLRSIVGIRPDPMMFVAINCANVKASKEYYEKLGFVEQPYPFARPSNGTGPFEPAQPKGSVYVAPSPNCMGILLLNSKKKKITPSPIFDSLQVVYTPSSGAAEGDELTMADPSEVKLSFTSAASFEQSEKTTR